MSRGKFLWLAIIALALHAGPATAVTWVNHHADDFNEGGVFNYAGTVDLATDKTSPDSTPGVWRFTFPQGVTPGRGIAAVFLGVPPNTNEMWIQYYFKYSPGFVYQSIATKQFYIYTTGSTTSNGMFWIGSSSRGYRLTPQGSDFANYDQNVDGSTTFMTQTGTWHKVKVHIKFNTGSTWNGIYQLWIDDVLKSNHSNVMWDRDFSGWTTVGIYPIWGGGSGNSVPQTQYFYVDGVYVGSTDPGGGKLPPPGKAPMPPDTLRIE
jgi:hypothetical protein